MKTQETILATSRPGPAFSNSTMFEGWSYRWCENCVNDSEELVERGEGCPLLLFSLLEDRTPGEWMDQPDDSIDEYHCIDFVERRDGDDPGDPPPPREPQPIPDPPHQPAMFPREPFTGTRMFVDSIPQPIRSGDHHA